MRLRWEIHALKKKIKEYVGNKMAEGLADQFAEINEREEGAVLNNASPAEKPKSDLIDEERQCSKPRNASDVTEDIVQK